jgi:hypothetical protein
MIRARTILMVAVLGVLTFAPRCATSSRSAAEPTAIPSEARDLTASGHPERSEGSLPLKEGDPSSLRSSGQRIPRRSAPRNDTGKESAPRNDAPAPALALEAAADPFRETIRPILSARCGQCHDPGGRMYARLPFDDPQVVSSHSAAVLRRLKGEDRAALEKWLAGLAPAGAER